MLVLLFEYLKDLFYIFNFCQCLIFRSIFALLTSFTAILIIGNPIISVFSRNQIEQVIRKDGPISHYNKAGTPTMGGILILLSIFISTLLWSNLNNYYVVAVLFTILSFGLIGFIDDYMKLVKKNSKGLSAKCMYTFQSIIGLTIIIILYRTSNTYIETNFTYMRNIDKK